MSTVLNIVQRYKKTTTVTNNHNHNDHHREILKRFEFATMLLERVWDGDACQAHYAQLQ